MQLLDASDGSFAPVLARDDTDCALVIFEARRYSRLACDLAREAKTAGVPVIADPYCDWAHEAASEVFVVPTHFNLFWEATAQIASLANLLVNGVFMELGPRVEAASRRSTGA